MCRYATLLTSKGTRDPSSPRNFGCGIIPPANRFRSIAELELEVLYEDEENSLNRFGYARLSTYLGPSANVSKCLCPCISFACCGIPSSIIHRDGLNCFASGPHTALERFTDAMGAVTTVLRGIEMWVTGVGEDGVITGLLRGIMSSSVAYSWE